MYSITFAALLPLVFSQCTYPTNYSGYEIWGLQAEPTATTPTTCSNACCSSGPACAVWQFCPVGKSCGSTKGPSCWFGPLGGQIQPVAGWVSMGQGSGPPTPPPPGSITLHDNASPAPIPGIPPSLNPTLGQVLTMDTLSLRINDTPILPFLGEIHPSRVPVESWRTDLLRMKAGGLTGVSAYIMWLHMEEEMGIWVDSGNRNVSLFLETAREVGLMVALRIGPWDHGECRNGGLPDWVLAACKSGGFGCRTTSPGFMNLTRAWYTKIAAAMKGYGWPEGGPVFSIQVDNETGDVNYLLALKSLAIEVGMNPAYFVKTGWPSPSTPVPYGSLVPLFGGYQDDFWSSVTDVSYGSFLFNSNPNPAPLPPLTTGEAEPYPFFTVEMGGGMASSYHRRIFIDPLDTVAQSTVFLGSGVANIGMYMYHGGTDPVGVLSTFQESQLSGYPNELPIRTYDFHAPVGEGGQPRSSYHGLRGLGMLMRAWGFWLAPLPSFQGGLHPSGPTDASTLRMAARSDGYSGLVFVNNRNIHVNMTPQSAVRASLTLADGSTVLHVPALSSPAPPLPSSSWSTWAFHLPLPPTPTIDLIYATAAPFTYFNATSPSSPPILVLHLAMGVESAELALNTTTSTGATLSHTQCTGVCTVEGGVLYARAMPGGLGGALSVTDASTGSTLLTILLLTWEVAQRAWVTELGGATVATTPTPTPHLCISDNTTQYILADPAAPSTLEVHTEGVGEAATLLLLPTPTQVVFQGAVLTPTPQGLFGAYTFPIPPPTLTVAATLTREADPARVVPLGPAGHAQAPNQDGALGLFEGAQVYSLTLGGGAIPPEMDVRLSVSYNGDCARMYLGDGTMMGDIAMDHFFNGHDMELPLTRMGLGSDAQLSLRVLPLALNAQPSSPYHWGPIYFEVPPIFNSSGVAVGLNSVAAVHTYRAALTITL